MAAISFQNTPLPPHKEVTDCPPINCTVVCPGLSCSLPADRFKKGPYLEGEWPVFIRDVGVRRYDSSLLVPYSFGELDMIEQVKALQPESSFHLTDGNHYCSRGFSPEYANLARKLPLPIIQGSTAIEGGNCLLFKNQRGFPCALVGINSLVFSLIAMRQQKLFSSEVLQKMSADTLTPSDWSFRMARNWKLYEQRAPFNQKLAQLSKQHTSCAIRWQTAEMDRIRKIYDELAADLTEQHGDYTQYRENLELPPTDDQREALIDDAKEFEVQIYLTKQQIAQELDIPLERIAFLEQERFHIDMDMFVANGRVFLHSEALSQRMIEDRSPPSTYLEASAKRTPVNARIVRSNQALIESLGCETGLVPGIYEASGKDTINFMNAVVQGSEILTNGAQHDHSDLQESFINAIHAIDPSLTVSFIGDGTLSRILAKHGGGLHCLTQEI